MQSNHTKGPTGLDRITTDIQVRRLSNRDPVIREYTSGKSVLDVGCIGTGTLTDLHSNLQQWSNSVRGIDIKADEFDNLPSSILQGNAETFVLDEPVDVVVAGELIEHLNNPGKFMRCSYENLKNGGYLVLTTPNSMGIRYITNRLLGRETLNREHTAWYDPVTLDELASRYGFELVDVGYVLSSAGITRYVERMFPALGRTIVSVFQK